MSDLAGQPVPQSDLPDNLSGQKVPSSDLPVTPGNPPADPSAVVGGDSGAKSGDSQGTPDVSSMYPEDQEFGDMARAVGRIPGEVAMGAFTFMPDMMAKAYNFAKGGIPGWMGIAPQHIPEPGDLLQKWFDRKVISPPKTPEGKLVEFLGSGVAGLAGGFGAGKAMTAAEDIGKAEPEISNLVKQVSKRRAILAREVTAVGGKVSPAYVGGAVSRAAQSATSKAMTHTVASEYNEHVADNLVKGTLGIPQDQELDETTFQKLREHAYAAYKAVAENLGNIVHDPDYFNAVRKAGGIRSAPATEAYGSGEDLTAAERARLKYMSPRETGISAQEMIDKIQDLRNEARDNLRSADGQARRLGKTQWHIATAMEDQLTRAATRVAQQYASDPTNSSAAPYMKEIVTDMISARQNLARINAVDLSMGPNGHVRAWDLAKLQRKGWPLDGGLAKVAQFAREFKHDWQPISEKGAPGAFSAVDFLLGGSGIVFHHPVEAGLAITRPAVRKALMSKTVQEGMTKAAGKTRASGKLAAYGAASGTAQGASEVEQNQDNED